MQEETILMKETIAALGLSAIFMSLASSVQGQTLPQVDPQPISGTPEITLSGDSLRTVENRSIDSDYQKLIAEPINSQSWNDQSQIKAKDSRFSLNDPSAVLSGLLGTDYQRNSLPSNPSDTGVDSQVKIFLTQ
jgi:hypothetical protein